MAVEDGTREQQRNDAAESEHELDRGDGLPAAGAAAARSHAAPGRHRARSRLREWFTLREAIEDARARSGGLDATSAAHRRRARLTFELAERVFDPVEPLRGGSGAGFAADLYRQATYWSLRARHAPGPTPPTPAQLWSSAQSLVQWAVPDPSAREALRSLFVESTFVEIGMLADADQQRLASCARALAHASLETLEEPHDAVRRLQFRRLLRWTVTLLVVFGSIGTAVWLARPPIRPDLAAGKPWRASSSWADCEPQIRRCGGLRTDVFFHTKEDASPWVEFDLGARKRFSAVTIKNRTDDAPDRAIPLVIEVSDDAKTWRGVARRKESFRIWTAEFKPQTARYVRARVDRRSYLHLEQVMIHP